MVGPPSDKLNCVYAIQYRNDCAPKPSSSLKLVNVPLLRQENLFRSRTFACRQLWSLLLSVEQHVPCIPSKHE
jgi:hypothetical protein